MFTIIVNINPFKSLEMKILHFLKIKYLQLDYIFTSIIPESITLKPSFFNYITLKYTHIISMN